MTRVIYRPVGDMPAATEWLGVHFKAGEAVEVTEPHILKKAPGNPFFDVEEGKPAQEEEEAPSAFERGVQAAKDGKPRRAPPAWHDDPKYDEWLSGFDSVKTDE